jgi:cytochrome c peroxidase
MRNHTIALGFAVAIFFASCHKHPEPTTTTFVLDLPAQPAEYYSTKSGIPQSDADYRNRAATLGRVLFYDTRLSVNNAVSCGSCHKQAIGFADDVRFSKGFEGRLTGRNSPGFNGLHGSSPLFWDARETQFENLMMRPITNHIEMGVDNISDLCTKLTNTAYYKDLFIQAFGDDLVSADRISTALSFFLAAIGNEHFGISVVAGSNEKGMTAEELQGKILFDTKYNCGSCHLGGGGSGYAGSSFSMRMEDIGLDATYVDKGRGAITGLPADMGKFKVPNLTNVALSAPYMHDGRYNTLEEVIDHYSTGINTSPNLSAVLRENPMDATSPARKMNISPAEKKAIVAFLKTLNDDKSNTDPKFSNPFKAQ